MSTTQTADNSSTCPTWCTEPPDHPFSETNGMRIHTRRVGSYVNLAMVETMRETEPAHIWLEEDLQLDAVDARRMAEELTAAADMLDGGVQP
jgi:hypothetical protein